LNEPILVTRDPSWAFGAEVIGNNFGVKKVEKINKEIAI